MGSGGSVALPPLPVHSRLRDRLLRLAAYLVVTHHTVGVLVLVRDGERILLVQQSVRQRGSWGLPGGFARRNERPEATARRELLEEAGIESVDVVLLDAYRQPWARHYELIYAADIPRDAVDGAVRGRFRDAGRPGWFSPPALPDRLTRETRHALDELRKRGTIR